MATQSKTTAQKSESTKAQDPKMAVRITSKAKEGIRRCGVRHPSQPTDYPEDRFSEKELKILKADPDLVVEDL